MEFHISKYARERYQFDQTLFSYNGNVIFANFNAAREFSQKINAQKDLLNYPEDVIKPGHINALGLMDEIFHHAIKLYRTQINPGVIQKALRSLEDSIDSEELEKMLLNFTSEFPPKEVYSGKISEVEYLFQTTEAIPNQEIAFEELLLLWITNQNPAATIYRELFSDQNLLNETKYLEVFEYLKTFFKNQPPIGEENQDLITFLLTPALRFPNSLFDQLEFIQKHWGGSLLGQYLTRLLSSLDLIREEQKMSFFGPGPVEIPVFDKILLDTESENFSPDREWMPSLVLIAKNSYVWLDQLSKKYQRVINRLDLIPDEELDELRNQGFTGLWLIGLWERSKASARIKQLCGNQEAISSAYSLYSYQIAEDLGGEQAFQNLQQRSWKRGIRLASDMVPNHMGIDSPWVVDHPDWFISLDYSPFPAYSFNGPDLSNDERVSIFLEDHYFDRSDAAVVFKRVDRYTGSTKYIYHGNDGTTMPWNDTAQLNYLNPEVREAVYQTILSVAKRFPIIRFDAAMTLAKKHYQRLWYPEPGTGGAIPSRSDFSLSKADFDQLFPEEFWREVVDRLAIEAPDTLLLAEAFWMMESYFVRTLGMHRVYNSAFMNILRDEDNAKYRSLIKNTIEFDPEILKRYVNFMNNPDERTAVDQFGKGDKYFGICTLLATLPGLPMFGHGQIEGFSEKYGMEFKRAYWDEKPDPYLIERHSREIFPILHKRALFANVENFLLFDFYSPEGKVNEDVFAFSNRLGIDKALVIYNNRFNNAKGWIHTSAAFLKKNTDGQRNIIQRSLENGLAIGNDENSYVIFRDLVSGNEFIRNANELSEHGLYFELNAYETHVFVDFREVMDTPWHAYKNIYDYLNGSGVQSIEDAIQDLVLQPVQQPFQQIVNPGFLKYLYENVSIEKNDQSLTKILAESDVKLKNLLAGIEYHVQKKLDTKNILTETQKILKFLLTVKIRRPDDFLPGAIKFRNSLDDLLEGLDEDPVRWYSLILWAFTRQLGREKNITEFESQTLAWIDEWQFSKFISKCRLGLELSENDIWQMTQDLRIAISQQNWFRKNNSLEPETVFSSWLQSPEIQQYLRLNRYKEVVWFNQEAYERLIWWMYTLALLSEIAKPDFSYNHFVESAILLDDFCHKLLEAEKGSGFQIHLLIENIKQQTKSLP